MKLDFSEITKNYPNIMLIDDEPGVVSALSLLLKAFGFQVTSFTDPKLAWQEIEKSNGSSTIILSDLRMPELSGQDLLVLVKEKFPTLPFILMSGHANDEDQELAQQSGCNGFLLKPFSPEEFYKILGHRL